MTSVDEYELEVQVEEALATSTLSARAIHPFALHCLEHAVATWVMAGTGLDERTAHALSAARDWLDGTGSEAALNAAASHAWEVIPGRGMYPNVYREPGSETVAAWSVASLASPTMFDASDTLDKCVSIVRVSSLGMARRHVGERALTVYLSTEEARAALLREAWTVVRVFAEVRPTTPAATARWQAVFDAAWDACTDPTEWSVLVPAAACAAERAWQYQMLLEFRG